MLKCKYGFNLLRNQYNNIEPCVYRQENETQLKKRREVAVTAFQFNCCKTYLLADGGKAYHLVGQLNRDIPFLARNGSGNLVTPFLLETDSGTTMANRSHAYRLSDGKMVPVEIPPTPGVIVNKMVKIPTIVVNEADSVKYFPFVATDDKALAFHKAVMKGDTVCVCGTMRGINIPGVGPRDVLQIEDVRLIRQSNRRIQAEAEM